MSPLLKLEVLDQLSYLTVTQTNSPPKKTIIVMTVTFVDNVY